MINPRLFVPDIISAASVCHLFIASASAAEAYLVVDRLEENPRKRSILRTLHRLYWMYSFPRIQFRSFLGVSMFLLASLSASLLIRPYLARNALPLPGASQRPPMPPSSNRATHSCTVRRSTSAKSEAVFVEWHLSTPMTAIILLRILTSLSAHMASVSSRIFLLLSLMDGSAICRSISLSATVHHEAKFSISATQGYAVLLQTSPHFRAGAPDPIGCTS